MKSKNIFLSGILVFLIPIVSAQSKWSLDSCIRYAVENNYTIKQNLLTLQTKKIELAASKMGIAPNIYASLGQNFDFGRAPGADGIIENKSQASSSLGVSLNLPVFEGLKNYNQIKASELDLQASLYELEHIKENIEINITAYYLQVLLNKEIVEVMKEQAQLSGSQIERIEELVNSGKSPDSELYTAKATYAGDLYNVTEAENNLRLAILDLRQLLNLSPQESFDIENIEDKDFENLLGRQIELTPIVQSALHYRPVIKSVQNRIAMSQRNIKIAQSGWYPSLSFSASYGTGYYYVFQNRDLNLPFDRQFRDYSRGILAVSLNIPIFDRLSTYHNVQRNKVNMKSYEVQLEETTANLVKEIEQAYTNAVASKEKYLSADTYLEASRIAFEYEELKYNAGASTVFEYNDAKTKYEKAQSDLIQAKYSFLIRQKILDFYGKQ